MALVIRGRSQSGMIVTATQAGRLHGSGSGFSVVFHSTTEARAERETFFCTCSLVHAAAGNESNPSCSLLVCQTASPRHADATVR